MCKIYQVRYKCSHTRTIEFAPCAASRGHMLGPEPPLPVKSTSSHKRNPSVREIDLQLLKLSASQDTLSQSPSSPPPKLTSASTEQPSEELPGFKFPTTTPTKTSSNSDAETSQDSPNKFKIPSLSKIAAPAPRPLPPLPVAAESNFFLNSFTSLRPYVSFKVEELIEGATFIPKRELTCKNGISVHEQVPQGLRCAKCRLQWMENARKCGVLKGGCVVKKGEEAARLMGTLHGSGNENKSEVESGWGVLSEDACEGEWGHCGEIDSGLGWSAEGALETDGNCEFDVDLPPSGARESESGDESKSKVESGWGVLSEDACEGEWGHCGDIDSGLSWSAEGALETDGNPFDEDSTSSHARESDGGSTNLKGLGLFSGEDSMSKDASYGGRVGRFGFPLDDDSTDFPPPSPSPSAKEKLKQSGSRAWWFMGAA